MQKLTIKENILVIQEFAKEYKDIFGDKMFAFDGKRRLTGEKLFIGGGQQISRNIRVKNEGYKVNTYEVCIKFANKVNMNLFNEFSKNAKYEEFQEVLQVLEIILRYIPSQIYTPVGK
jgi:hypothetical protein